MRNEPCDICLDVGAKRDAASVPLFSHEWFRGSGAALDPARWVWLRLPGEGGGSADATSSKLTCKFMMQKFWSCPKHLGSLLTMKVRHDPKRFSHEIKDSCFGFYETSCMK